MAPALSICIPTHDGRAGTLSYALDELLGQAAAGLASRVEVCISDNASRDGTEELIRDLSPQSPAPIRYRRNEANLGPGRNFLQVIEMATGGYCWLMSSDDALAVGGLSRMLELIDEHPGIAGVSTTCQVFDAEMERQLPTPAERFPAGDTTGVVEGLSAIVDELGPAFIGMSGHVVARDLWLEAARTHGETTLMDGLLPHVGLLVGAAQRRPRWLWCPEPLVRWRSVHIPAAIDDFMAGILDDLALSLSRPLGPRDPGYRRAIARFARTNYAAPVLRTMATLPTHTARGRVRLAYVLLRRVWWLPDLWRSMIPSLLVPGLIVRAVRRGRRVAGRRRRLARRPS